MSNENTYSTSDVVFTTILCIVGVIAIVGILGHFLSSDSYCTPKVHNHVWSGIGPECNIRVYKAKDAELSYDPRTKKCSLVTRDSNGTPVVDVDVDTSACDIARKEKDVEDSITDGSGRLRVFINSSGDFSSGAIAYTSPLYYASDTGVINVTPHHATTNKRKK